jgi:hypothetical protein
MPRHENGRPELRAQQPFKEEDGLDGQWPREQLIEMNQNFCERVSRALARNKQTPPTCRIKPDN